MSVVDEEVIKDNVLETVVLVETSKLRDSVVSSSIVLDMVLSGGEVIEVVILVGLLVGMGTVVVDC